MSNSYVKLFYRFIIKRLRISKIIAVYARFLHDFYEQIYCQKQQSDLENCLVSSEKRHIFQFRSCPLSPPYNFAEICVRGGAGLPVNSCRDFTPPRVYKNDFQ